MPCWQPQARLATLNGWSLLVVAILMFATRASVAADSPIRTIEVTYDGEAYVLNAVMFAPVAPTVAWDVLTDFDHMAQWVPNVAESRVVKREDTSLTIQQHGVAKYGALSFPFTTERKVELTRQDAIKANQIRGSLRRVESMMRLEPEENGTRLIYHLEIVPSFLAAAVMSKAFLEHEIGEQFGAIVGEMIRRAQKS